ncbi:MAG: carbohydrate ABC transporter permease [Fimbriimonadaceae bacterium]|nr:carbohydrate ABC transporter permease [Fimbriimonadaceae bacterium]QYK58441.1 MAG: carbohydrate ABC transporter permease [Fimbriimonadaceae bacterium]
MIEGWVFAIGALLHVGAWILFAWLLVGLTRRIALRVTGPAPLWPWGAMIALGFLAAAWPLPLGRQAPEGLWVPLVVPVMPFPAWFFVAAFVAVMVVGTRLALSATRGDRAEQIRSMVQWVIVGMLSAAWFAWLGEPVTILRGALPVSPVGVAAVFGSLVLAVGLMARVERRLNQRGLSARVAATTALVAGTLVFALPLAWLVLTSFKEHQDNTSALGLVWVPRVTKSHAFVDPERPLVEARFRGQKVLAKVVSEVPYGLALEVERPYALRGWRFQAPKSETRDVPRQADVVTWPTSHGQATGFVRENLVGGVQRVEGLSPESRKGQIFELPSGKAQPVREFGIRWQNYPEALEWLPPEAQGGLAYLRNTLWLVTLSVVGNLLSCSLVAYGFARLKFVGRSLLFGVLVSTLMLPPAVTMLPRFMLWRDLGFVDTLVPLWLPTFFASAFNVFLLRQFFVTVPVEMEQAAKIDGCSPLRVFWQVSLPQIKPALMVVGLWSFMGAWNDFMGPLIYVSSPEKMPLTYGLQLFYSDRGSDFGLMMAFATLSIIPVFLVFLFGQRYLTEGAHLTGLGGR